MSAMVMANFDKAIEEAKGNEEKMDLVLRAKWLYIHRGQNVSTVDNPQFDKWRDMIMKYINKSIRTI